MITLTEQQDRQLSPRSDQLSPRSDPKHLYELIKRGNKLLGERDATVKDLQNQLKKKGSELVQLSKDFTKEAEKSGQQMKELAEKKQELSEKKKELKAKSEELNEVTDELKIVKKKLIDVEFSAEKLRLKRGEIAKERDTARRQLAV